MKRLKTCIVIIAMSIMCTQPVEAGVIRFVARGVKGASIAVAHCTVKVAKVTGKGVKKGSKAAWKVIY